jgi:hypothetical protein
MRVQRITLAALILGVTAVSLGLAARYTAQLPKAVLWLRSGYSSDVRMGSFDAHSISFSLERIANGWVGSMTLDPNQQRFSQFGHLVETTLMTG